jgi:hypothetical protein
VWGLDEYHFFPFLWGAAQLRGHDLVQPKSISNDEVLEAYAHDYMYVDSVLFVRKVKKGPLHETAPMLYDITAVPNWAKVWLLTMLATNRPLPPCNCTRTQDHHVWFPAADVGFPVAAFVSAPLIFQHTCCRIIFKCR